MTKLLTALAVLLSLTCFAQAQDLSVLTANVSGTVTFSSMEVGCKKLDDVMDQSSAYRTASSKKTGACEFISKDKEYQVLKTAASKAWPTTHAALCISQDRSGSCLWVVANKSKLTSDVVGAATAPEQSTPAPASKRPEPWDEGWTASQVGKPKDANPYPTGSPDAKGWDTGWRAGGVGRDGVRAFYRDHLGGKFLPPDVKMTSVSRTVGESQIVEELLISFTHTMAIDWLLPGVAPTGKPVEMAVAVVVGFKGGKISHEHIYWDQAGLLVQVGLLDPKGLPVTGAESARKVAALTSSER